MDPKQAQNRQLSAAAPDFVRHVLPRSPFYRSFARAVALGQALTRR